MHFPVKRIALSRLTAALLLSGALGLVSPARADESGEVTRLLKSGSLDQALARADAFLASKPRDPQMRFLKGLVLTEQGKTSDAIKIFTRLTEDFPELPEPYNNLAVLHAGQGQFEKARQSLEMAIRTHPTYATAYENLGDVYSKLASQSYDKALQLDSGNSAAEMKLSMVREMISGRRSAPAPAPAPVQVAASTPAVATPPVPAPAPAAAPAAPTPNPAALAAAARATAAANAAATAAAAPATTTASVAISTSTPAVAPAAAPAPAPAPAPVVAPAPPPAPVQVAAATPATSQVMASVGGSNKANDAEIMRTIRDWATAWSNQNVDDYLAFYASDFDPSGNQSRSAWERERRSRINGKGRIEIRVDSPIIVYEGGQATVQFKQTYVSDRFTNVSIKTLVLAKSGNRWMILREKSSS